MHSWCVESEKCVEMGIFSDVQWWKKNSTHFSDSTHQQCIIFAGIGSGPCYKHCDEICASVYIDFSSKSEMQFYGV